MPEKFTQKDVRRALDRMKALSSQPQNQAAFAAELLAASNHPEILDAAFRALRTAADPGLREVIITRIEGLAQRGDPGGTLRGLGIQALTAVATAEDRPRYLQWCRTYERSMQDDSKAGAIRAAAIAGLARIDAARAVFEAIRLLGDMKNASQFTGEPAVTAATVLAELGETAALYTFCYTAVAPNEDVLAEALRGLKPYPDEIIDDIIRTFAARELNEPGEAGLIDLAISTSPRVATLSYLRSVFAHPDRFDLYGYAATAIAAARNPGWLTFLAERAETETDRSKLYMLRRALPLAAKDPSIAAALASVEEAYAAAKEAPAQFRPGFNEAEESLLGEEDEAQDD